jgi:hypothetical protein
MAGSCTAQDGHTCEDPSPCEVTHAQVSGISAWHLWGSLIRVHPSEATWSLPGLSASLHLSLPQARSGAAVNIINIATVTITAVSNTPKAHLRVPVVTTGSGKPE